MRNLASCLLPAVCLTLCCARPAPRRPGDPIEPVNRRIFWFNDKLDVYVLEPAARGWDWLMPDAVQRSVANFFDNVRFPIVAVNDLLQGKVVACGSDIGRFAVNTTVGVLGFMDPAGRLGPRRSTTRISGRRSESGGIPPGPYLVLPLLGPSNPRDTVGLLGDSFAAVYPWFVPWYYTIGPRAVDTVNFRSQMLDAVREAKRASVDYYAFVRDAYVQRRKRQVVDRTEMTEEEQEELYYLEEE